MERKARLPSEAKAAENFVEKPKTLAELRAELVSGRTKAADLAAGYYDRIASVNPRLNVYLSLTKERAMEQAERMDALAAKGDPLPVLAGVPVGIKDVLVMKLAPTATVAGVFTANRFCAAPVQVSKAHLESAALTGLPIRALVINTGNANAGTGSIGMDNARASCAALAALTAVPAQRILPFSTGVIGEHLPVDRLAAALPAALENLAADHWAQAAKGIMTRPWTRRRSADGGAGGPEPTSDSYAANAAGSSSWT